MRVPDNYDMYERHEREQERRKRLRKRKRKLFEEIEVEDLPFYKENEECQHYTK